MLKKPYKTKVRFYGLIALVLTFCLILTVMASIAYSPKDSGQAQNSPQSEDLATPNPTADTNVNTTDTPAQNVLQDNSPLITKEQALNMAVPIIDQYATENNLTILSVNVTLAQTWDFDGLRGGPTLPQLLQENLSISEIHNRVGFYPVWSVEASFPTIKAYNNCTDSEGNSYVIGTTSLMGYSVLIWADTGQIFSSHGGSLTC